jgi:hypothetical protein
MSKIAYALHRAGCRDKCCNLHTFFNQVLEKIRSENTGLHIFQAYNWCRVLRLKRGERFNWRWKILGELRQQMKERGQGVTETQAGVQQMQGQALVPVPAQHLKGQAQQLVSVRAMSPQLPGLDLSTVLDLSTKYNMKATKAI